jgi:hypothetical protein
MHRINFHGNAAAIVPVSLLANPVHLSRTKMALRLRPARIRTRPGGGCRTVPEWN